MGNIKNMAEQLRHSEGRLSQPTHHCGAIHQQCGRDKQRHNPPAEGQKDEHREGEPLDHLLQQVQGLSRNMNVTSPHTIR